MNNSYHINPSTGRVNICRATKQCPFGGSDVHFPTKEEARRGYERTQNPTPALRKRVKTTSGKSGAHNIYASLIPGVRPRAGEQCDLNYFSERDADEILDSWERPFRTNEVSYDRAEALAINYYQMAGHKAVGEFLRAEGGDERTKSYVSALKKALAKGSLHSPITLFRGVKGTYAEALSRMSVGDVIAEPSFSSTTPSEKGALTFAKAEGVMLQIEAPAGLNAIDLGAGLFSIDEDEILIGQNLFVVKDVKAEELDGLPITRVVVAPLA